MGLNWEFKRGDPAGEGGISARVEASFDHGSGDNLGITRGRDTEPPAEEERGSDNGPIVAGYIIIAAVSWLTGYFFGWLT